MYSWLVFLHVLGVMAFMLAHGGTTVMTFQIQKERDPQRMRTLLDLSGYSWPGFALSFLLLFVSGIIAGFMGRWWSQGWIWTSLVLLLGMSIYMGWSSRAHYHKLRKALGLPYFEGWGDKPAIEAASEEEILAVQAKLRPVPLAILGFGITLVILWLMMFKPF
jgi:hypothetical protein